MLLTTIIEGIGLGALLVLVCAESDSFNDRCQ